MGIPLIHLRHQGPVLATLLKTALFSSSGKRKGLAAGDIPLPGPWFEKTVPMRSNSLVNAYILHVGGSVSNYRETVPFHLFPQWTMPIMAKTLESLPYNLTKVINGGSVISITDAIARDSPLRVKARLDSIEETSSLIIMKQRLYTGDEKNPQAIEVVQTILVPLPKKGNEKKSSASKKKEKPRVPENVREIGRFRVHRNSGLEFGLLTGDLNPLHWIGPVARAMGQRAPILHGFSTLGRTVECIHRNVVSGNIGMLKKISTRFTRPLVLPGDAGVFITRDYQIFCGDGPNGPVYLSGQIELDNKL